MPTGQVKWFDPKKGYGFIIGPEGQDVFVHYSHIQSEGFRTLKDGASVEYELVKGDKGWQARNVKATGDATPSGDAPVESPSTPSTGAGYESSNGGDASRASGYEGAP